MCASVSSLKDEGMRKKICGLLEFCLVWFLWKYISPQVFWRPFILICLCYFIFEHRTAITLLSVGPFGIKRGFTVRGYETRLNDYWKKPQLPLRGNSIKSVGLLLFISVFCGLETWWRYTIQWRKASEESCGLYGTSYHASDERQRLLICVH